MPDESLSMATNLGESVKAEHDGWKIESSSAIRPTEAQLKESLGAPPEEKPAEEEVAAAAAEEVVAEDADVEAAVADDPPAEEKPLDASSPKPLEAVKPKKLTRSQELHRDIGRLTKERGDITRETAEARAQRQALTTEIAELEAKRAALKTPDPKPAEVPAGPRKALNPAPKPTWAAMEAAGKTYEDFLEARDDWAFEEQRLIAKDESTKTVQDRETAARDASTRDARTRAEADIDAQFQTRLANAKQKHADVDFDAVLAFPLPISSDMPGYRAMSDRIRISEFGPELLLYFTESPDDAKRLCEQPWPIALAELGMIEGGIKARVTANSGSVAVPAPSKAHAPIKPVRVAAPVASDANRRSVDDMPFGPEYLRATNKVLGMR